MIIPIHEIWSTSTPPEVHIVLYLNTELNTITGEAEYLTGDPAPMPDSITMGEFGTMDVGWTYDSDTQQYYKCVDNKLFRVFPQVTTAPFLFVASAYPCGTACDLTITGVSVTHESAPGAKDGTATIFANTSNGNTEYSKDNGATWQISNVFTNLAPGFYGIRVRDTAECTDNTGVTIKEYVAPPTPPEIPEVDVFEGLNIQIGNTMVDVPPGLDVAVNIKYQREDGEDFQRKRSSEALNVSLPATLWNQAVSNHGHLPEVLDMTPEHTFESHRPAVIRHKGFELLVGKAFLQKATYQRGPVAYEYSFYGNNADWMVDLQDTTLLDLCKHIFYPNTVPTVVSSWLFDGRNEAMPYVFAPVRYVTPFVDDDTNVGWQELRPSLSKYFIIYWAFKSLGYRVQSEFFDTDYFRRQVIPWTWGNYLKSEGLKQDNLDFRAISSKGYVHTLRNERVYEYMTMRLENESTAGGFDNNGVYSYDPVNYGKGTWVYLPAFDYGAIEATFYFRMDANGYVSNGSSVICRLEWFKNGASVRTTELINYDTSGVQKKDIREVAEVWESFDVVAGDTISVKLSVRGNVASGGEWDFGYYSLEFDFEYFKISNGGIITFEDFNGLQKYKFLDFLRGVVDEFNLDIETDSVNKVVLMEPSHDYSLTADPSDRSHVGYFNGKTIDWTDREDINEPGETALFSDMEQNLAFAYKPDDNDGVVKSLIARSNVEPGVGRYVFPSRFKKGKKEFTNRFFSPSIHYTHTAWASITGTAPQLMAFIPENISDTSSKDSTYQFAPRSAYYKGLVPGIGWRIEGQDQGSFPLMFAVNYMPGGENDPVLSYSDELIGDKIGTGLLKRFFWQRLANLRAGRIKTSHFRLHERDVQNWFHREHIVLGNLRFELRALDFRPLTGESTECELRMYSPISAADRDNTYPSENTLRGLPPASAYDTRYAPLTALQSDIPK